MYLNDKIDNDKLIFEEFKKPYYPIRTRLGYEFETQVNEN